MKRLLLLLSVFWRGCPSLTSDPPLLDAGDELLMKVEEPLILNCTGSKQLHWKIPFEYMNHIVTGSPTKSTLTVQKLHPLDTGYFYCYYENVADFESDKDNVDSTYVYVHDENDTGFVKNNLPPKNVTAFGTMVIDCIVTHPDLNITLFHKTVEITSQERVSFDPRKGFSVRNVTLSDEGTYKCMDGRGYETSKQIHVTANRQIHKPTMHEWKNQHYVKGDSFKLQCRLIDPPNTPFNWTYPNSAAEHIVKQGRDNFHKWSTLTVRNASESDTGNYTCTISAPGHLPNSDSKHITIREKLVPFVNVTGVAKKITEDEGQNITWHADLLYYPDDPVIKYTDWRGHELVQTTDRITIEPPKEDQSQSRLHISNIHSSDFGNYTVTVTTGGGAANDSFTFQLQVNSRPHMKLSSVPSFLTEGMSLNITCSAEGFPLANVSVQFQDCSSGNNSCSPPVNVLQTGKENTDIPATGNIVDPGNIVEKNMAFSPNTSGKLWCVGENINGTGIIPTDVIISDIGGMFVLRHRGENETAVEVEDHEKCVSVVENDPFSLICGGSKLYYRNVSLTHTSSDSSNPNIFQAEESNFSWIVNKTVDKATKVLAGSYNCTAELHEGQQINKRLTITIHGEEKVHFTNESNLNNKTVVMTKPKPFNLSCSVAGKPEPTVQWVKDGKVLNRTSEFFDKNTMEFSSNSRKLIFSIVVEKHVGVYTCVAKNRVNEVTGSLTISVPGVSKGVQVGLTISLVGIALLVLMIVVLLTRVKREIDSNKTFKAMRDRLLKDNIGQLNPNCTVEQQAVNLPYDESRWEVPRRNITPGKLLGSGAFGQVIKATVTGLEGRATTTVAIKMCKNPTYEKLEAFLMELKIMIHLGKHLNIVNLMGASTVQCNQGDFWILVEYCRFGDLLNFMKRHRKEFINQIDADTGKIDFERTAMGPSSPLPYSSRTSHVQALVDTEGYVIPSSPHIVLSAPPQGHCAKSVHHSTVSSDNSSAAESTPLCLQGINHAENPLYCMGVSTSTAGPEEGIEGHEGFCRSLTSQGRDSRHLTPATDTLLNTTSDGSQPWSPGSNTTNLTRQTSSPLSPTDSCFMGGPHSDPKGKAFTYGVGSVPGFSASFSTRDLLSWGWQVAQGMAYLSRRKILHGDLAARNLLLADNNVVKISDFGLSRDIYKDNIYKKKKDALMPIKWLSVEGIRDQIFSEQSDVWAFGITLWEIFSLGGSPYPNIECCGLLQHLEDGHRMGRPKYANDDIHTVMMECWKTEPMERPSFSRLVDILGLMMPSSLKEEYLVMNDVYMQMNEERFKDQPDYLTMMASPTYENLTKAEEPDGPPHEDDQEQINNSASVKIELPCRVSYTPGERCPSTLSTESNYLPMKGSVDPVCLSSNVFSPRPQEEPSERFTFSNTNKSIRLSSLPEEEETNLLESKESSANISFQGMTAQPPSEDTACHNKCDIPVAENINTGDDYLNISSTG